MKANTNSGPGAPLKSELARLCLPSARRDPHRKLAWMNSVCFLFLLIGVAGFKPATFTVKNPPPLQQSIPVIIEPTPPPPTRIEAQANPQTDQPSETPRIVVVVPNVPAITFSVPNIGNLIAPVALAVAPPFGSVTPLVAARNDPTTIRSTGTGGERPDPPYPQIAHDLGQQGTVLLTLTVDANGSIIDAAIKESSGSRILDHSTLDFVKRHWLLPAGAPGHIFEAPIHFVLQ